MKNTFPNTQLRLVTWYIGICVLGFFSVESSCSCRNNDNIDHTPPTTLSLQFAKLSYDRSNKRLVVIIKNTSKETAKNLSLWCTNISKDDASRTAVLFNNTVTTTTIPISDIAAGASTQEMYIAIDFQTAKKALVQMEIIYDQQVVTASVIQVNQYPIDLLIDSSISIVKQGETREFKWKLLTDPNEQFIDFTKFQLTICKEQGKDIIVSLEGIGTILDQSTNCKIFLGTELEKLAKQQEILLNIKNNTTDNLNQILFILSCNNGENIANIFSTLVPEAKKSLLPAVIHGNVKLVEQAIAAGADVNARNTGKEPALHLATQYGHQEIVQILLNNGADINAIDNDGNTALHLAASKADQAIARLLLQHRANKSIKNNSNEIAADLGKDQELEYLFNNWKN